MLLLVPKMYAGFAGNRAEMSIPFVLVAGLAEASASQLPPLWRIHPRELSRSIAKQITSFAAIAPRFLLLSAPLKKTFPLAGISVHKVAPAEPVVENENPAVAIPNPSSFRLDVLRLVISKYSFPKDRPLVLLTPWFVAPAFAYVRFPFDRVTLSLSFGFHVENPPRGPMMKASFLRILAV